MTGNDDRPTGAVDSIEIVTPSGRFRADAAGPPDAPVVLLLHGFPQSRHTWRQVVPALAGSGYRAVAPDQRGYSSGVRPRAVAAYSTGHLVGDVLDLLDALEAPSAHLVGHDWGGQVAWLTAAHHPDRVATLCVLSRPHPAAFAQALSADPEQATRSGHHRSFQSADMTDSLYDQQCRRLRTALSDGGVPGADIDAYLGVFAERSALDAALNWYRAAGAEGLRVATCPDVSAPTLYLWGDHDFSVGRAAAELTAGHVLGPYRFVEVPGSGHFLTDDGGADTVITELLAHLARSSG